MRAAFVVRLDLLISQTHPLAIHMEEFMRKFVPPHQPGFHLSMNTLGKKGISLHEDKNKVIVSFVRTQDRNVTTIVAVPFVNPPSLILLVFLIGK